MTMRLNSSAKYTRLSKEDIGTSDRSDGHVRAANADKLSSVGSIADMEVGAVPCQGAYSRLDRDVHGMDRLASKLSEMTIDPGGEPGAPGFTQRAG